MQLFLSLRLCLQGNIELVKMTNNRREKDCGMGAEGLYIGEATERDDLVRATHRKLCYAQDSYGTVCPALQGLEQRC